MEFESKVRREGYQTIIGIDEAGRGPLAGPVVAAAVLVNNFDFQSKIDDSKKLSLSQREKAFCEISENAIIGVGIMCEQVIDHANILNATMMAMHQAIDRLFEQMERSSRTADKPCLLIDGNYYRSDRPIPYKTIVGGDKKVFSIQCASIVAKVTRDRILYMYDMIFPEYGFKSHKGYGTVKHRAAIQAHGPAPIHRQSFRLVS